MIRKRAWLIVVAVALLGLICVASALATPQDGHTTAESRNAERAAPWTRPALDRAAPPRARHSAAPDDAEQLGECFRLRDETNAAAEAASPIVDYHYQPYVLDASNPTDVLLRLRVDETVTSLVVELFSGGTFTRTVTTGLNDFWFSAQEVLTGWDPQDSQYRFGHIHVYIGSDHWGWLNLNMNICTELVPAISVQDVAPDLRAGPHAANLLAPGATPGATEAWIVQRFYGLYPDDFDFLNVVWVNNTGQNRTHASVSNDVQGTGVQLFDNSQQWGSAGRLKGINRFPVATYFDPAEWAFQHETGHQWINFAIAAGRPHWPLSEMAQGIMGRSIPGGVVGGQFPWRFTPNTDGTYTVHRYPDHVWDTAFCDLDLYLMGLLPAGQVNPALVFENQDQSLCEGCILQGPTYYADAQTVIDLVGPRVPDASASQKTFNVGTLVVSLDRLLLPHELAFFDYMADRATATEVLHSTVGGAGSTVKPWWLSTRNLSTLNTVMVPMSETPTPTATPTQTPTPTVTQTPTGTPAGTCTPAPPEEVLDQAQTQTDYGYLFDLEATRWQEFMPTLYNLTAAEVYVRRTGNPGDVIVEIKTLDGTSLRRAVFDQASVASGWLRTEFCPAIVVVPGTKYRIHVGCDQASPSPADRYVWRGSTSSTYNPECVSDVSHLWPEYDYAFRTYGMGSTGPTWTPTQTPTPPASLPAPHLFGIVNDDGNGYYLVDWSAVQGATLYVLDEDDNSGFWHPEEVYRGSGTMAWMDNKSPGTYYYRVKASDGSAESDWSNVQSVAVAHGASTPTLTATCTATPTPSATPTHTATPTSTAVPAPPTLLEPADGEVLPQPVQPYEWRFVWDACREPCVSYLVIEGPGGRYISAEPTPPSTNGYYEFRYTGDEYLPDQALAPWHWHVSVCRQSYCNSSERRTFSVEPAHFVYLPVIVRCEPSGTPQ